MLPTIFQNLLKMYFQKFSVFCKIKSLAKFHFLFPSKQLNNHQQSEKTINPISPFPYTTQPVHAQHQPVLLLPSSFSTKGPCVHSTPTWTHFSLILHIRSPIKLHPPCIQIMHQGDFSEMQCGGSSHSQKKKKTVLISDDATYKVCPDR